MQDKTAYYAKMLEHSVLLPNEVRNQEGYESVDGLDIYGMTKNSDWLEQEKRKLKTWMKNKHKNLYFKKGDRSGQNN